jgi:hypothetical protein
MVAEVRGFAASTLGRVIFAVFGDAAARAFEEALARP